MISRRVLLRAGAVSTAALVVHSRAALAANAPGITDVEIKFGQTMPYSGPASAYGVIGRTETAYFKMINDRGGINGRKLKFISLDDGFSPPKTVEQTRRLIEQERVAFIFQAFGAVTNLAVRPYLNDTKVPQLFGVAAADQLADPARFPWTIGLNPAAVSEAHIYAKQILTTKPDARIGVLYQNDILGKTLLRGMREVVGPEHAAMIVKDVAYEISQPTIDSEVVTLQAADVDTLIIAALSKAAAQVIRKTYDIGWTPDRYLFSGAASIPATLRPAGLDKSVGLISAIYLKDPGDTRWKDDPGYREWTAFVANYMSPADLGNPFAVYGFDAAKLMTQVLMQCGDDLSRENIMSQALNIKNFELPMGLPATSINTSPDNYFPMRQMQLARFNGTNWELFGDVIDD